MIALLAFVLAAVVPATDPLPKTEEQIVVIGEKQKKWRGFLKYEKGVPICKTKKSTGDREIDKIGCDAMIACFPQYQAQLDAFSKEAKNKAEYSRKTKAIYAEIAGCVGSRRDEGVADLSYKRAGVSQ